MAALNYLSYKINTASTATTVTVDKPTNLAVGDLMLAQFSFMSNSYTITLPSGWTSLVTTNNSGTITTDISYKVADASDVAASNFTFNKGTGTSQLYASILRITGQNTTPILSYSSTGTNSTTSLTTTTITPNKKSSLYFIFGALNNGNYSISDYSIATDNPTWTEIYDYNGTSSLGDISCAYATRLVTTATGTVSATASGSCNTTLSIVEVIVKPTTQTITDTLVMSESYTKKIKRTFTDTVQLTESLAQNISRLWTKVSKPVTTWINKSKN